MDLKTKLCNLKYKITKQHILGVAIGALVVCGGGAMIYANRDQSRVMVCESATTYNEGIGLTFYLGRDGKTIDKIEKVDTVSLEFIKNNLTTNNSEKILEEYKNNVKFLFDTTMEKYKDVSFFKGNLENSETAVRTTYTFDVGSKTFNYEKNKSMMEEFSLDYYYDKDAKAFIYDESKFLSDTTPLGNIENVSCKEKGAKPDIKVVQQGENKKTDEKQDKKEQNQKKNLEEKPEEK